MLYVHSIEVGAVSDRVQRLAFLAACSLGIAFVSCYVLAPLVRSLRSPLRKLPGPWYAPLTTLHLRYAFARGTIWKLVESKHRQYGPVFRYGPRQIWISDKDALRTILQKVDLPKIQMYAEISRDAHSPGLFGEVRPDPHKTLKRFLSPRFTVAHVDKQTHLFEKCIGDLIAKYYQLTKAKAKTDVVVTDLMMDLHGVALDIMGECSFGRGFGQTLPVEEEYLGMEDRIWLQIPHSIFHGMTQRYKMVYIKRWLRGLGIKLHFDWPADMIRAIDAIVRERSDSKDHSRTDLLQHFLDSGTRPDSSAPMNTRDIIDQVSEILPAGSETTSGTIACLFLELLHNPDKKAKLLDSLPVLTATDPIINSKTVRTEPEFRYLNACIKETLRLHPIASEMGRKTGTDWYELAGYSIPPGTVVSASYRHLHRNPEFWPEPLKFWPERWLEDENARDGAPEPDISAYYPFSAGQHSCIGINFARAEMRMVAANVFARFDLEDIMNQHLDFRQYITMQLENGSHKVVLKQRF
ncbi:cytochrome P450 [Aspergillus aculeatinus CBS 121060]|uniref:Cytochrome P450 n=2 Tax=Aspergillus subgen. Circumdati TaxID=2720871 RepID=A0ACD1GTZ0_9EURO|nr:cytochrome P450 [Aspergillus aculeatinus CBS 121060]RAH64735.1 cytochrome P450 [Aspergillus aculeatinus CBS 121060]